MKNDTMSVRIYQSFLIISLLVHSSCVYQRPDMQSDISVKTPMFDTAACPKVAFDAGHSNFHDIRNTYAPFAALLRNDGILLSRHEGLFTEESLKRVELLIIANAMSADVTNINSASAFTKEEIHVLVSWIEKGGALLLIADHDPFGSAASDLARSLGVGMESVWTVDTLRMNKEIGNNTWLEYTVENGGLGIHTILRGENPESGINRVITFTGQSLSHDSTWTSILKLSKSAQNYYMRADASTASNDNSTFFPVPDQSQLIACEYGGGRIVIAGEAAMFTAQEARKFFKFYRVGFNYNGYDNKQLVLNIVHWLLYKIP